MKDNRLTNFLLGLLVLGVWGILIHSTLHDWTPSVEAQTKKVTANLIEKRYELAGVDERGNVVFGGGNGNAVLTARGLQAVLAEAPAQGWKVHSVVFADLDTLRGWSVIVEK